MTKRDMVIGAVTGYEFDQIAPWVNSLDRSGFDGFKVLLAYNMDAETSRKLQERGYVVVGFQQDPAKNFIYPNPKFSIVVERFFHYYAFLNAMTERNDVRYVLATDVKDVIFQRNPSESMGEYFLHGSTLLASSEELTYEQEPWGRNNLRTAFGEVFYEYNKSHTIYNAGVIAGEREAFVGLCKTISLICMKAMQHVPGGGGPDQAAYNLIMSTDVYKRATRIANHSDDWAAQLGTTMDPSKMGEFRVHLAASRIPGYDAERELVVNPTGEPYTLVHQWDRVPEVRSMVERKYR
jgi:hypothetical protein